MAIVETKTLYFIGQKLPDGAIQAYGQNPSNHSRFEEFDNLKDAQQRAGYMNKVDEKEFGILREVWQVYELITTIQPVPFKTG